MLDVTDGVAGRETVDRAFLGLGRIEVVVNNAGYGPAGAAEEVSDDQLRHQIDLNLIGSMQVNRSALPHMRSQGGGKIMQVTSERGQVSYANLSIYNVSKWGIEGFVELVAIEVAPLSITCTIVQPGSIRTTFRKGVDMAQALDAYTHTPAGELRRHMGPTGYPLTVIRSERRAMISCSQQSPPPSRLTLGSGAYIRTFIQRCQSGYRFSSSRRTLPIRQIFRSLSANESAVRVDRIATFGAPEPASLTNSLREYISAAFDIFVFAR